MTPLDLTEWETRLKAECPAFGNRVFRTLPDDELTIYQHESPIAFVYEQTNTSDENRIRPGVMQRNTVTVTVEIIIRRARSLTDRFDQASTDDLKALRETVINALIGWRPSDARKDIAHASAALKARDKRHIKWTESFTTELIIHKPAP